MNTTGVVSEKGLATTKNSKNGKTALTISTDGTATYYGYVENAAGSNECSKTIKLDKTPPELIIKKDYCDPGEHSTVTSKKKYTTGTKGFECHYKTSFHYVWNHGDGYTCKDKLSGCDYFKIKFFHNGKAAGCDNKTECPKFETTDVCDQWLGRNCSAQVELHTDKYFIWYDKAGNESEVLRANRYNEWTA